MIRISTDLYVKIVTHRIKFAQGVGRSLGQMPHPSQIPVPGQNFWSNAPGSPGGMGTLGID